MNVATILRADFFSAGNVGTQEQRQELINRLIHMRDSGMNDANQYSSNENCWRYTNPITDCKWMMDSVISMTEYAIDYYQQIPTSNIAKYEKGKTPVNIHSWANINGKHSRNVYHAHKGSHFSCVFYLQGTGTGNLILTNPANILNDCNNYAPFARDFLFQPKDGDLIMWPSWMPHEVEMNLSDRERINIVFDITIQNEFPI